MVAHTINLIVDTAMKAISCERLENGDKQHCAVVKLDVEIAFNSAKWDIMMPAIRGYELQS